MFTVFTPSKIIDLFYHAAEPDCIGLALADLQSDLRKLSGRAPEIKPYLPKDERGYIAAGSLETPAFREFVARLGVDTAPLEGTWEGYLITTFGPEDENLLICGTDRRGAMWGIYDFCEKQLGVDPLYFWTDHEPQPQPSLELPAFRQVDGPKTFTYRGVFVNDEDLLTEWKDNGGKRYTTYPFYHQVTHPSIIEKVVETILRLKMNLIIPASLLDIDNPAEENLVRLVTERGLYVSQHHIEPVGVSHFAWDNFWAKRGEEVEASYVRHPDKFEEIWRYYAQKWAQYPGVIWQFGLRGRGDRPVWFNDSSVPPSNEARGQLISAAYAKQAQIVAETLGTTDFVSTSTLWMEGSELQRQGCLEFPDNTVIVFADFGPTQMMVDDFYETQRDPQRGYGVYHHVAFWGDGPHLAMGTSLDKLYYNYTKCVEAGDTQYSILNVSNFREFSLGIEAVARMNWDCASFDPQTYRSAWFERQFGADAVDAVEEIYQKYFNAFAPLDNTRFPGEMVLLDGITRAMGLMLVDYDPATFGKPGFVYNRLYTRFGEIEPLLDFITPSLAAGLERWKDAYDAAFRAQFQVSPERCVFFRDHWIVQIEIMLGLYGWCHEVCLATRARLNNDPESQTKHLRQAVFLMEKLLVDRAKAEHGKWQDWYRGDKKMNLPAALAKTRSLLAHGELP